MTRVNEIGEKRNALISLHQRLAPFMPFLLQGYTLTERQLVDPVDCRGLHLNQNGQSVMGDSGIEKSV